MREFAVISLAKVCVVVALLLFLPASNAVAEKVRCPKTIPDPYTGPLLLESKYVQSDTTKSTLKDSVSTESEAVKKHIQGYTKLVVSLADFYLKSDSDRKSTALHCLDLALSIWADANALLSKDASKTGKAVRKWALAAVAMAAYKVQRLSDGEFQVSDVHKRWLTNVADKVVEDYQDRLSPDFRYFNNHDYWAAWSVTATALVTNEHRHIAYAYAVLDRASQQVVVSTELNVGWLPNETARGALALNYLHYALTPLVMLDYYHSDFLLSPSPITQKLMAMVRLLRQYPATPDVYNDIMSANQKTVAAYKAAWLIPYLHQHPQDEAARNLYGQYSKDVDGYSQLGGMLLPLFPLEGD